MERKAFFFDYDGTLVDDKTKKAPHSAIKAITDLKKQGHLIFVNTGRTKAILDPELFDWPFDGMILGCGTYIEYHGEILLDKEVAKEVHEPLLQLVEQCHAQVFFEGSDALYLSNSITRPDLIAMIERYQTNGVNILSIENKELSFNKLFVCFEESKDCEQFKKGAAANFTIINRGVNRLELVLKGYSKATGIQYLCEKIGIAPSDCYVFGDSNNDLPMFEYIKNSILIGGENPELSDRVMLVSDSAKQDGVAKALKLMQFIK